MLYDLSFRTSDQEWDHDEVTIPIKLKTGDEIMIEYFNKAGVSWKNRFPNIASFTGALLYKI